MAKKPYSTKVSKSKPNYVAFDPANFKKAITSGSNVGTVIDDARRKGVEVPAVIFIPKEGVTYLY